MRGQRHRGSYRQALGRSARGVAVNYASSKAGADAVVAEITTKGGKAVAVQANLAKKADIERLFAETQAGIGGRTRDSESGRNE